jgi:hypothetical protein
MNIEKSSAGFPGPRGALALGSLLVVTSLAPAVHGQDKPRDPAAAEALYLSGRKLVNDGNWVEGCGKFRASMELNPASSTLINIAKCSEHEGKLTQALVDYRRAIQLNQDTLGEERKKALEQVAKDGIAAIEPRLARVELAVKTRPEGLTIVRDGAALPLAALGETIPLDPGPHTFEATAPGYRKDEKRVELDEGENATVELLLVAESADPKQTPPPDKLPPGKTSGRVPVWAYIAGGVGLAAIGGAVFFRIDQLDAEETISTNCPTGTCDPTKGYDPGPENERKNRGFALFVGLGAVGVVGLGAAAFGIVRGLTQKKAQSTSLVFAPHVGPGSGGFVLRGAF